MAATWTFLTNHAHVLIALAQEPGQPLREVASRVGITERAAQRIVMDLDDAGFLTRRREGRQNHYSFDLDKSLRHPLEAHCKLATLLEPILGTSSDLIAPPADAAAQS